MKYFLCFLIAVSCKQKPKEKTKLSQWQPIVGTGISLSGTDTIYAINDSTIVMARPFGRDTITIRQLKNNNPNYGRGTGTITKIYRPKTKRELLREIDSLQHIIDINGWEKPLYNHPLPNH